MTFSYHPLVLVIGDLNFILHEAHDSVLLDEGLLIAADLLIE
jgi:hypothetical protein